MQLELLTGQVLENCVVLFMANEGTVEFAVVICN